MRFPSGEPVIGNSLSLHRFFAPRSVAFVGATEDASKFGGKCFANLLNFGFGGRVMPINPKRDRLFNRPCFASVDKLPEVPDHVGIALSGSAALDVLEQCGRLGIPFATVFSAGFSETATPEGEREQARLQQICRDTGIRVMGPNCNGVISFVDRFALSSTFAISGGHSPHGDIAIASQSGGAGQINVMWRAMQSGLGISYQVSSGNDADLDLLDYIDFMVESESTKVVLVVAERISSGERLRKLALKAAALDKPIVMLKVGRSAAGSAAAASHTGSITGADEIADAALEQWGILRVHDTEDLCEFARLLRRKNRPRGRNVAAASVSGGSLVIAVDTANDYGLEWPPLSDACGTRLQQQLPNFGKTSNPLDLTAAAVGRDDALVVVGQVILEEEHIDTFVPVVTMTKRVEFDALTEMATTGAKPTVVLWTGSCVDDSSLRLSDLVRQGVPVFDDTRRCFRAIAASAWLATAREKLLAGAQDVAAPVRSLDPSVLSLLRAGALTERESKALVATYGVAVTVEALATTADAAADVAMRIGATVALKIESPDILHKTEAGAIRLGLASPDAVRAGFAEVMDAAKRYAPQADIRGVLVQEMVPPGIELLLGLVHDPVFGSVVTVGHGGIYVEVMNDVARRVAPVDVATAHDMLQSLRIWPILAGTRGQAGYDAEAVVGAIVALSRLGVDYGPTIREIDINPLVVQHKGQGVRAVDALVIGCRPR
ncbi:succinyl-CoA synthetase subunit alpha [Variovorax sp. PBL-H6]|uniref:acetate--CoA ligase family protein n=1 Tax=Variovorax sp. PBL-H6 TaxID=434009 RepID=UPI001316110F|nr:acetate--CoA ligase family protein [Variovorax sp. PBL-H6]VTU33577.1 succinyl-CoA synthetase subunit alpha [Variovorax sp. PBL-H6]